MGESIYTLKVNINYVDDEYHDVKVYPSDTLRKIWIKVKTEYGDDTIKDPTDFYCAPDDDNMNSNDTHPFQEFSDKELIDFEEYIGSNKDGSYFCFCHNESGG